MTAQVGIDDFRLPRRQVLVGSALGFGALAGCLGRGEAGQSGGTPIADHPAASGLETQPRRGPDPFDAPATIIAFEDPSCTRCRAFERNVVPKLESHVDAADLSLVVRTYPVVYPWGKPAVQALEATFARDVDAFWGLFDHYFATQPSFASENVLARTRDWLSANTTLDADGIVADAEAKKFDGGVQADVRAGDDAGADGVTPSLFLFRGGNYQTKARGSVSYDVIAGALGL